MVRVSSMPTRRRRAGEPVLRMSVEPQAGDDLRRSLSDRLDLFNVATTGIDRWHALSIFLRDPDDEIVGGLLGQIWGGWLHVSHLWIAEPFRGAGHASGLLREAERFAIARGCHAARLDSHSFQAPDFYVKHGYHILGVLEDYPPGHQLVFLRKTLAADAAARTRPRRARTPGRRRGRA
ncbi:MAG: GNAT family N-acetyltransferase [Deltaproteobacteria bacterium]|nr:GNAT family N-acetyltransferase [Deltaproteobacteria bacterium]